MNFNITSPGPLGTREHFREYIYIYLSKGFLDWKAACKGVELRSESDLFTALGNEKREPKGLAGALPAHLFVLQVIAASFGDSSSPKTVKND